MQAWLLMALTLTLALLLFRNIRKRMADHALCLKALPNASELQSQLDAGFSGYLFLMDLWQFPESCADREHLASMLSERGHRLFALDAPSAFQDRSALGFDLQVRFLPALMALQHGKPTHEAMLALPGKRFRSDVMWYVEKTEGVMRACGPEES